MYTASGLPLEQSQQTWFMIRTPSGFGNPARYSSRTLAESALFALPEHIRNVAEIVSVDSNGRQLLFENV